MKHTIWLLLLLCSFTGCEPKWDFQDAYFTPRIVVEGWIESGGFATVSLTQTRALDAVIDSARLADISIRWAKVSISDGVQTEVLTGRIDRNYTPPFIYTGSKIRGEAGKSYTLKVEYSGHTLTAETSIPEPVRISDVKVERCIDNDTLYQIKAYFKDDKSRKNYYKFFTKSVFKETRYYSSFMGTLDDSILPEEACITVYRGFRQIEAKKYSPFFRRGELVNVKLTQITKEGFDFWSSYENEVTNGKNILFPSSSNIKSNINGGLGIWCGYGVNVFPVTIYLP